MSNTPALRSSYGSDLSLKNTPFFEEPPRLRLSEKLFLLYLPILLLDSSFGIELLFSDFVISSGARVDEFFI